MCGRVWDPHDLSGGVGVVECTCCSVHYIVHRSPHLAEPVGGHIYTLLGV